ncbi:hypothetical protein [Thalassospira alkalitolerans]|uniref:hypothetical protein n=1 Tax=Thalassospira alkalitolerans TaxID=1293890 RepID=UPI003AA86BC5
MRRYVLALCFCLGLLAISDGTIAHAQDFSTLAGTERALNQFEKVKLHSFADRDAFLAIIDRTLGLKNIKGSDTLFAKLPRSPFTITGRRGNNQAVPCQIFIPAKITPGSGTEIFADLMRGWFGNRLSYASSAEVTFGWLMRHEVRHCDPTHFGDKGDKERDDEIEADLFALNAVTDPQMHDQLAQDALAFRMITASLFASKSHMTGLSLKRALAGATPAAYPPAKDEIAAFLTVRKQVFDHAKAISVAARPSNQDVIRAVIELSQTSQDNPLATEILGDLDQAIAHFAPKLHSKNQSVQ